MDWQHIIDKYYGEGPSDLKTLLLTHSRQVARRALHIVDTHPDLGIDRQFVLEAAMIHDIGIIRCDAPGIFCYGADPYIRHGVDGGAMMRAEGYPRHARVCERHTGAGLSRDEIVRQQLPLPHVSLLPETMEEQVICYADKFYSKSHLDHEKTIAEAEHSLAKFGEEGLERFHRWVSMFE